MKKEIKPHVELDQYQDILASIGLVGANISSINTLQARRLQNDVSLADFGAHVFNLIEEVHLSIHEESKVERLTNQIINVVSLEAPLEFRPQLFERLNQLVSVLMSRYFTSQPIFNLAFKLMTVFKTHIDTAPQTTEELEDKEFHELEKSVFMLTDWEDQIKALRVSPSPAYNPPT